MPRLEFSERKATIHRAIVVSFDLVGFSNFCNQAEPAVAVTVPLLFKRTFDCFNEMLSERDVDAPHFLMALPTKGSKLPEPTINKYTGDGALMLWLRPSTELFPQEFCNLLVECMRKFQDLLTKQLPIWEKEWRVSNLPRRARVGIATGVVYSLRPPHILTGWTDPSDYVGYCINLAIRLQNHCPSLGFLVHRNLHPELPEMNSYIAVRLKGSQDEPVILFSEDIQKVSPAEFNRKFKDAQ